jgi:hypothetical protein
MIEGARTVLQGGLDLLTGQMRDTKQAEHLTHASSAVAVAQELGYL